MLNKVKVHSSNYGEAQHSSNFHLRSSRTFQNIPEHSRTFQNIPALTAAEALAQTTSPYKHAPLNTAASSAAIASASPSACSGNSGGGVALVAAVGHCVVGLLRLLRPVSASALVQPVRATRAKRDVDVGRSMMWTWHGAKIVV
jgi:hypothetical protein